ncbi:MAG: 50S ribosomal protein L32 [bacterium]
MALPKRKHSKARTSSRKAQWKIVALNYALCSHCGHPRLPHTVCSSCGYYNNELVVSHLREEIRAKRKERKQKEMVEKVEKKIEEEEKKKKEKE